MEHKGTKRLETERLILRPFEAADAAAMYRNWASDPEVTKFLTWPAHRNPEASQMIVDLWTEKAKQPEEYIWAIVPKELGEPAGSISGMHCDERVGSIELGYCIGRAWWGRGMMPEAVRAVIRYLIGEAGLNRVWARHDVNNPNSGRVMQKAGMTKEGVLRAAGWNNQGICDEAVYSVLADEPERATRSAAKQSHGQPNG